jgi:hypothetical protein
MGRDEQETMIASDRSLPRLLAGWPMESFRENFRCEGHASIFNPMGTLRRNQLAGN